MILPGLIWFIKYDYSTIFIFQRGFQIQSGADVLTKLSVSFKKEISMGMTCFLPSVSSSRELLYFPVLCRHPYRPVSRSVISGWYL